MKAIHIILPVDCFNRKEDDTRKKNRYIYLLCYVHIRESPVCVPMVCVGIAKESHISLACEKKLKTSCMLTFQLFQVDIDR